MSGMHYTGMAAVQACAARAVPAIGTEISGDLAGATSQPDVIVEPGAERPGRSEK